MRRSGDNRAKGVIAGPEATNGAERGQDRTRSLSMKPGTRLQSAACDCEVVVIRYGGGTIGCGGAAMSEAGGEVALDAALAGGSLMGKRYVDAAGTVELLCVKAGKGSLTLDGTVLATKDAKPLPASD
jgi:hypothetical protein